MSRRILVAVDSSRPSLRALDLAAALANEADELALAFVEDASLLRIAEVPAARVVGYPSATMRRVDPSTVQRELAALAERMLREARARAAEKRVRVTLRQLRGQVAVELIAASEHADIVVLGRASQHLGDAYVGSNALAVARGARRPVLLAGSGVWSGNVTVVVLGEEAIPSAVAAVRLLGVRVVSRVVVVDGDERTRAELARLAPEKVLTVADRAEALSWAAHAGGPVVIGGATEADLTALLARTFAPILVAR